MKHHVNFTKMHGLGNDFVLIDAKSQRIDDIDPAKLAIKICDRNLGVGADGLVLVLPSSHSDFKMRIFNPDGTEPEMCGNAIRCFSKFVYEQQLIEKEVFSVETLAGTIVPALIIKKGLVNSIEVDMGEPILDGQQIPVTGFQSNPVIAEPMVIADRIYPVTAVSMGNPHAVIFLDDLHGLDIAKLGPTFEHHQNFPKKVNVEFAQVLNTSEVVVKVWERGAGETLACGTGACATVVAGVLNQKLNRKIRVHLPGGDLEIEWQESDNHIIMSGPAQTVFKGEISL